MSNNKKSNYTLILLPLCIALSLCLGIWLGTTLGDNRKGGNGVDKFNTVLGLIDQQYVDTVNMNDLIELALPDLISQLDPHSAYISKEDLTSVNEELDGSFSGVGISFQISNDSVMVVEVIAEGPAEKVGLQPGDRIIFADDVQLSKKGIKQDEVFKTLRGPKGTNVKLKIKRGHSDKLLTYDVKRDEIPDRSVNAAYMLNKNTGYVKVSKFSRTTYDEFMKAMTDLQAKGASRYVIDLRDNSGGYMDQAILMANEFLQPGQQIVYTKGRISENNSEAVADGTGAFMFDDVAVLTNEFSASASEIFAGAIQDNDRGIIVGRRSFGKGLVQNQINLPDGSALRLTVARYYTPSGRSIQKEYKLGETEDYQLDIMTRYNHGEFYNQDSIKLDKSKVFKTRGGRNVYGGGGIMPDIFVPEDTTGITSYYMNVANAGLIQRFAFDVTDKYRSVLKNAKSSDKLLQLLPRDETLLNNFVDFGVGNGVPARWYYIRQSRDLLLHNIKSMIVRDVLGYNEFYKIYNQKDPTIIKAVEAMDRGLLDEMLEGKFK